MKHYTRILAVALLFASAAAWAQNNTKTVLVAPTSLKTLTLKPTATQVSNLIYTYPDAGANANFVMTEGTQTINGTLTLGTALPVGSGGTGATTLTNHGILLGQGTSAVTATAVMTDGQFLVGQSSNDPLPKTMSGDATLAASGALTIANNAVSDAKLRTSAGLSVIGRGANSTGNVADITGTTDQVLRVNAAGNGLGFGTVATGGIANAAVTYGKIQNVAAGKLLGNSTAGAASIEEIGVANGITLTSATLGLGAITPTSVNGLTLQANLVGFQISGGTTSKTLTVPLDASVSGTNTGDVTLTGENYLSITNQQITANAVNLGNTNATGTLAAARFPALTGDVTTTAGSLATSIANNAVTDAKLRTSAGLSVIGRSANSTGNVADITAATDGHVLRLSGTTLGFGQVATAGITNAAVTYAKIQDVAATSLVGNSTAGATSAQNISIGDGLSLASATLSVNGKQSYGTVAAGATIALPANKWVVLITDDAASVANALTLPATPADGQTLTVINGDAQDTSTVVIASGTAASFVAGGGNWYRVQP